LQYYNITLIQYKKERLTDKPLRIYLLTALQ
jgi:hypothetical protein